MAYLSKDTLLKVYRVLSENTETPDTQGSTQKISAVRHLFALARYVKVKNQSECNLRDRTNKDTFVDYVGDIVKLDDGLYTTNFYTGIKDLPDCGVSSNFFSAGAVAKSKVNTQVSIPYPASNTLFNVHNESLVPVKWSQIPLDFYITSTKCRLAFALWLVRKNSIDEENIINSVRSALVKKYPEELVDILLTSTNEVVSELNCSFSSDIAIIEKEDIFSMLKYIAKDNSLQSNLYSLNKTTILGPIRGGYLNEGKRGFLWEVLKYFNGIDGVKKMAEGGLFRNPENKYAYIGPTPVAHIETVTDGITVDTMVIYDGTILSKNSEVAEFYNGIEAFNKFYAGCYEIEVSMNRQGDEVYYLHKLHTMFIPIQRIYYGAPGTGKSHEVKIQTGELDKAGNEFEMPNVFRTTFHPDTDYASFVGCYKPTMKPVEEKYRAVAGKDEDIAYEFVPQVFTDAYIYAYNHLDEATYLVIEEINRGNCAQVFGDLFQLLDRKADGKSEYTIKADKDLAKYLIKELGADNEGIKDVKLRLPANLNILATMNTSDQSLFPMDSAFKRRWDWEYVAISYTEPKSSSFQIKVGEGYSWVKFIEQVNKRIFALTQSEDKEMGNFFIKKSINPDLFKSKVMFYLWYEVLRDEVENSKYFFYYTTADESGKESNHKFTFKDLYGENSKTILEGFLKYITKDAE